jgi:uncharacterized protein
MPRAAKLALIDPERLSATPMVFEGTVKPGDLERLSEALANGDGELRYKLSARRDIQRRAVVSCIIEGFVFLTCRVSLDTFRQPVSIDDRMVLVDDESRLPPMQEESDTEDYLVVDEPIAVLELVEDAVILALPMMPRKPGLEFTEAEAKETPEEKPSRLPEENHSPFAQLSKLKKIK